MRGGERGRRRFNGFRFCALPLAFFYDVGAACACYGCWVAFLFAPGLAMGLARGDFIIKNITM